MNARLDTALLGCVRSPTDFNGIKVEFAPQIPDSGKKRKGRREVRESRRIDRRVAKWRWTALRSSHRIAAIEASLGSQGELSFPIVDAPPRCLFWSAPYWEIEN